MPFVEEFPLVVRQVSVGGLIDDKRWQLMADLIYLGDPAYEESVFVVPRCHPTDFASVPRILTWLIPPSGRYTPAAVLHDYFCDVGHPERHAADGLFRRAMGDLGVPTVRRYLMWAAVRCGSLTELSWGEWLRALGRHERTKDWLGIAAILVMFFAWVCIVAVPALWATYFFTFELVPKLVEMDAPLWQRAPAIGLAALLWALSPALISVQVVVVLLWMSAAEFVLAGVISLRRWLALQPGLGRLKTGPLRSPPRMWILSRTEGGPGG